MAGGHAWQEEACVAEGMSVAGGHVAGKWCSRICGGGGGICGRGCTWQRACVPHNRMTDSQV